MSGSLRLTSRTQQLSSPDDSTRATPGGQIFDPPTPEFARLTELVEGEFGPDGPWEGESFQDLIDGDFSYITVAGAERGRALEEFIAGHAAKLGLVVYSPQTCAFVTC